MEKSERGIKELRQRIKDVEDRIGDIYREIGALAFSSEIPDAEGSIISGHIGEIREIDVKLAEERGRLDQILAAVERAEEIEAIRKSLTTQIRSIEKDNMSNYETIGRAVYEAYIDGSLSAEKYAGLFTEVDGCRKKIDVLEKEKSLLGNPEGGTGFFRRMKDQTRVLYLKGVIANNIRSLQRLYKKAGERICHSELVMNLEAESLENALKPFKENIKGIEKLEQEDQKLHHENEQLKGDLAGLGVETNVSKSITRIEKIIEELYSDRQAVLKTIGEVLYMNRDDCYASLPQVVKLSERVDEKRSVIQGHENEIKRIEAEMEIEKQNAEIERLNKRIDQYKDKITVYNSEAEQLKERLREAEDGIRRLEEDVLKNPKSIETGTDE